MAHSITVLRMTAEQHTFLRRLLFRDDGCESVALALCGTRLGAVRHIYSIHEILGIPPEACSLRSPTAVRWPVELGMDLFAKAVKRKMAILKIHSHPTGFDQFSKIDDESDATLLGSLSHWGDHPMRHISAYMLPDGIVRARLVDNNKEMPLVNRIAVAGDEIRVFASKAGDEIFDDADLRTRQAFGDGTTTLLKSMRIGVAGCSGTGSWVVEMLARLGVGELVLVDPDCIERKNLNRIVNSTGDSARLNESKVGVLARAIAAMGLGTKVEIFREDLSKSAVIEAFAECDVLFGCLDSADGRDLLNRIATFYSIPYIDVGVRLDANGKGGVTQICCAIHFIIPGGSSLLSRGVINSDQIAAQSLRRQNPEEYQARLKEGYIQGVAVDSPAVISINGFAASHAVNELLARLHPFRADDNSEYRYQVLSLRDGAWLKLADDSICQILYKRVGRGDSSPRIDNPFSQ